MKNMAAPMISRFKGCLVGGVVGDCIGGVFEGLWGVKFSIDKVIKELDKIESVAKKKEESTNESPDSKKQKSLWCFTDDTAMARSVAKSLIANNSLVVKDVAKRFAEEFFKEKNRGYGGGVVSVFHQLAECECLDVIGPASRQFDGQGSYGNGGAMRIAPLGLYAYMKQTNYSELQGLYVEGTLSVSPSIPYHVKATLPQQFNPLPHMDGFEYVEKITRITHTHKDAILGSILQCYAVFLALHTDKLDVDVFIDTLVSKLGPLEKISQKMQTKGEKVDQKATTEETEEETYMSKLETIRKFVKQDAQPSLAEVDDILGTDISALRSAPTALYCFLRATKPIDGLGEKYNAFERTIIYAISLGGDTDTIATMAGAIAGAYYGVDMIPNSWQICCEGVEDALKDAEAMFKLS